MFNDPEFFDTHVYEIPMGMKMKSTFYELPYWDNLVIFHLLDILGTNIESS